MESARCPPSSAAPCWVTNEKKAKTENQRPAGECDDLNMKVRDAAALVASALWAEGGSKAPLDFPFHV